MSIPKLDRKQIIATAAALDAEGIPPTKKTIRERVGPLGSDSTIQSALDEWRNSKLPQPTVPESALPETLQQALLDWRAPLECELAEQKNTVKELSDEGVRLLQVIDEQDARFAQISAEKVIIVERAAQLTAHLADAREDVLAERRASEAVRKELATAIESIPQLKADLAALRAELATAHQVSREAEKRAGILGAEKAALECRLDDARQDAVHLRNELKSARDEAARERQAAEITRAEMAKTEQRAAIVGVEKGALEGRLVDAKQDADRLRDQITTAQASAEQSMRGLNARIEDLLAQIGAANRDADHARAATKAASEEVAVLRAKIAEKPRSNAPARRDGKRT